MHMKSSFYFLKKKVNLTLYAWYKKKHISIGLSTHNTNGICMVLKSSILAHVKQCQISEQHTLPNAHRNNQSIIDMRTIVHVHFRDD